MKCNHCGKEVEKCLQFFDSTPGAVIIAEDSDGELAVWPACHGLEKRQGCVEFSRAVGMNTTLNNELEDSEVIALSHRECDDIYGDHPPEETAWLVKPLKDGYEWTEITDEIDFSD